MDKYIRSFDVSMDDASVMQPFQGLSQLSSNDYYVLLRQTIVCGSHLQALIS
jgi:hypothetical protein